MPIKKPFKAPPPSVLGRLKLHNRLTPEMAERHMSNVKMRNDRIEAEKAANHRTEYNKMVGHTARRHPHAAAAALHAHAAKSFTSLHGSKHLPK